LTQQKNKEIQYEKNEKTYIPKDMPVLCTITKKWKVATLGNNTTFRAYYPQKIDTCN
jgi:hypothetical protein